MKIRTVVLMLLLVPVFVFSQTVHQVEAGKNVISAALAGAAEGDIIELTTSGGVYQESDALRITFGVTFRAAEGLAEKPVVVNVDTLKTVFYISEDLGFADNWWLKLDGIRFDAMNIVGTDTTKVRNIFAVEETATDYSLSANDCVFENTADKVMVPSETSQADSVMFTNCLFQHIGSNALFFRVWGGGAAPGSVRYFHIEDCTFFDINGLSFDVSAHNNAAPPYPQIFINHVTIYKQYMNAWWNSNVKGEGVVKNVILHMPEENGTGLRGFIGIQMGHCLYGPNCMIEIKDGSTEIDSASFISLTDPLFVDAANGDLRLYSNSPAIGAADDGGNLGDRNWDVVENTAVEKNTFAAPAEFSLQQNYPNPFNPSTQIAYTLDRTSAVHMDVYDALGRRVASLVNAEQQAAGHYSVEWNGTDMNGNSVSSGVYFTRLQSNGQVKIIKMVLMK